jgi:hypothetical protein
MLYKAMLILLWSSGQATTLALPTMAFCEIQKDIAMATFKQTDIVTSNKPYLHKAMCMPQATE